MYRLIEALFMANATARIVVQATPAEKKELSAKASQLGMPIAELMRRGARSYRTSVQDAELIALADAARNAAERAASAIDEAISFVRKSDKRIAAMEMAARRRKVS
jgi:arsenate reductase-like glutaredoxin family protein